MEKRVLLAFALSVAVLIGYSLLFPTPKAPLDQGPPPGTAVSDDTAVVGKESPPTERPAPEPEVPVVPTKKHALPEKEVVVDTELYRAVLSSRGGVIKSWKLKKYTGADDKPIEMTYFDSAVRPLLVVPEGLDPVDSASLDYIFDSEDITLEGDAQAGLTMTYSSADGRQIIKKLLFRNGSYAFDINTNVRGFGPYEILMGESFGSLTAAAEKGYGHLGYLSDVDGSIEKDEPDDVEGFKTYSGASGWVSVTDKYFIGALVPMGPLNGVLYRGSSDWGYVGSRVSGPGEFMAYAGPKDYDVLKSANYNLDKAVDFGWFSFIAKPLFVALKFFYDLVGNYGWAIIIITIIIKLIFAPLTHKQQKSMKRMQKLQPKINELKEKFKGDAQRMNAEMMELYKREKVNPLGGCLPMIIQIPVFIALYNVLQNAIELRHAPFMWWLQDLSAKDPYYILPVVMGLSMFAMQKMTPTTVDPKQNKIMMIMPVVLTFLFINLPSGLVLYFTISNILSMVQQLYINKTMEA